VPVRSLESDSEARQGQTANLGGPRFACGYGVGIGDNAGGHDLTGRERGSLWLAGQHLDEVGQGEQRTAEHMRTGPMVDFSVTLAQDDFGVHQPFDQVGDLLRRQRLTDDEPTVQPVVGGAMRQPESPARMVISTEWAIQSTESSSKSRSLDSGGADFR
jgi:hypothetical protein